MRVVGWGGVGRQMMQNKLGVLRARVWRERAGGVEDDKGAWELVWGGAGLYL